MGMSYLLTLYCAIRGMGTVPIFVSVSEKEGLSPSSMWWQIAAVAACALGMATKEVMVTCR